MIIPDKKKAATIIISQMHGYPESSEEKGDDSDESSECEALGRELLDALAAKDAMAAYDAVKAIFLKVDAEPHEEYEEEEEEEEGY